MRIKNLVIVASLVSILAPLGFGATGDPLPDVDVSLERKPSDKVFIEVANGAPFDSLTLSGPKDFIASLEVERLPPGWSMTRDGKSSTFRGPAVSGPTRLKLRSARTLDKSVDWDVSLAGRSLARLKNVVPRTFDAAPVRSSLQGVVSMPPKVSPGEAIALQPLPGANLPPGRFVLSGVVTEPVTEEQVAEAKSGLATVSPPRGGFVLEAPAGTSCRELLPLAAAMVVAASTGDCATCKSFFESRSNTARAPTAPAPANLEVTGSTGDCANCKSFFESRSNTAIRAPRAAVRPETEAAVAGDVSSWSVSEVRARHDVALNAIRNIKSLAAVAPSGASAGFTIDEKGVKRWDVDLPGGSPAHLQVAQGRSEGKPPHWVALEVTETSSGCLVLPRETDLYDFARAAQQKASKEPPAAGKPDGAAPLQVGEVPGSVLPGTTIALKYLDLFGDPVVDVPVVSETEVVPPSPEPEPPCVTAATAYAQAEDTVCVCGNFPTLLAQAGVRVDGRDAGTPTALSTRTLQYQLPRHAVTPGFHLWSGDPAAGFPPTCRAQTQVIHIQGEIDSQNLLSGQSTPMRLTVNGTTDKVSIQIKNLTPEVIRIEGGETQTVESSGGTPNTLTRSVQGLGRGAFNVEWSLAVDRCPCR